MAYLTAKWHIAKSLRRSTDARPLQRGFDHFYGTIIGAGGFYNPTTLTHGNENVEHEAERDPSFLCTEDNKQLARDYFQAFLRSNEA